MTRNDLLTLAQRLREYNHNPHHINPTSESFHNLIAESASVISMLATPPADAADMGGQAGEVEIPDIVATFDGLYLIPIKMMKAGEHLMTVAQHRRILAAEIQKRFDGNEQSSREHSEELAQHRQQAGKLVGALGLTVLALDQLLPYLSKVPADVGLINEALVAARPLLEK